MNKHETMLYIECLKYRCLELMIDDNTAGGTPEAAKAQRDRVFAAALAWHEQLAVTREEAFGLIK